MTLFKDFYGVILDQDRPPPPHYNHFSGKLPQGDLQHSLWTGPPPPFRKVRTIYLVLLQNPVRQ